MDERFANLGEVVRRHVRCHADGDAAGAIHEQVLNAARRYDGSSRFV
jgi:hypothetical protein